MKLTTPIITLITLISLMGASLISPSDSFAQFDGSDVGFLLDVADTEAKIGDILITSNQGLVRANTAYHNRLFGVIQNQPLIVFRTSDGGKPVARSGVVSVTVTTINGTIVEGDYVTSSEIPGKGQKAHKTGYVIGVAMENFNEGTATKTQYENREIFEGNIKVALKIEFAEISSARSLSRLADYFNSALFRNLQNPERFAQAIRYVAAGLIILVSFGAGFATFSNAIVKGVEAVGRNPLAKNQIYVSIGLNIVFILLTTSVGIAGALIIAKL